jgi:stage II sporulation protein D
VTALVAVSLVATAQPTAHAQSVDDDRILAREVVIQPYDGTHVLVDDRTYAGDLTLAGHVGGLSVVEETTLDSYLLGIREVPFSWPEEALKAQAVAARTYLAWTLQRGRSANGRRFGYDICATVACQVYAGLSAVSGPDGDRWRMAVESTDAEILLFEGDPAQALYSSTSDGRTRNVEDVFLGAAPAPYLRSVDSPGEASPFVEWSFFVPYDVMEQMLRHAGLVSGELVEVSTDRSGTGPWVVEIAGTDGIAEIDTWSLRSRINRAASDLFPERFPAYRPGSDRRYPQTIMSPAYSITSQYEYVAPRDGNPPELAPRFLVRGGGWGHLVGMSQFGAEAMAAAGEAYDEILAHFYGGLRPLSGDGVLPDRVRVGLATEREAVTLVPDGPVRVLIDGAVVAETQLGTWEVASVEDRVIVTPPVGLGIPPSIGGWRIDFDSSGRVSHVRVDSATAAEIRLVVTSDRGRRYDSGVELREAGVITIDLESLGFLGERALVISVAAKSPLGEDLGRLRLISLAE